MADAKKVKLRYSGPADVRSILKSDFKSEAGVEDQEAVEWSVRNRFTAEVSEAAAEYLVRVSPTQFSVVND